MRLLQSHRNILWWNTKLRLKCATSEISFQILFFFFLHLPSFGTNDAIHFRPNVPIDIRMNAFHQLCTSLMQNVTQHVNIWPLCMLSLSASFSHTLSLILSASACFPLSCFFSLSIIRFQEFPPGSRSSITAKAGGCSLFSYFPCPPTTWPSKLLSSQKTNKQTKHPKEKVLQK